MNGNVKLASTWRGPRSVCTCGCLGDGSDSDHRASLFIPGFDNGHGSCRECGCTKFTWAGFTPKFTAALARQKGAK